MKGWPWRKDLCGRRRLGGPLADLSRPTFHHRNGTYHRHCLYSLTRIKDNENFKYHAAAVSCLEPQVVRGERPAGVDKEKAQEDAAKMFQGPPACTGQCQSVQLGESGGQWV